MTEAWVASSVARLLGENRDKNSDEGVFDPKVFWSVNALVLVLILGACMWCWCKNGGEVRNYLFAGGSTPETRLQSDLAYQQTMLARQRRREERRRETPEKRRRKLVQSFQRCQVSMIVEATDLVGADEASPAALLQENNPLSQSSSTEDPDPNEPDGLLAEAISHHSRTGATPAAAGSSHHSRATKSASNHSRSSNELRSASERSLSSHASITLDAVANDADECAESSPEGIESNLPVSDADADAQQSDADDSDVLHRSLDGSQRSRRSTILSSIMSSVEGVMSGRSQRSLQVTTAVEASERSVASDSNSPFGPQGADLEAGMQGFLVLRHPSLAAPRRVPNCCAICLCEYEVGEKVVWSSNQGCPHAFHAECIVDWLTKMQDGTPCPCCRQTFTDLEEYRKERKITWRAGHAFNPAAITLR